MPLHSWDLTPAEGIALQKRLAGRVRVEPLAGEVRTIAGVDCAFAAGGREILAAAVLLDAESMETLASAHVRRPCTFPYVPGLLSFREAPARWTLRCARGVRLPEPTRRADRFVARRKASPPAK